MNLDIEKYYRFLGRCDLNSKEHRLLKSGVETTTPTDSSLHSIIPLCEREEAQELLKLARLVCPDAIDDIMNSIKLARTP